MHRKIEHSNIEVLSNRLAHLRRVGFAVSLIVSLLIAAISPDLGTLLYLSALNFLLYLVFFVGSPLRQIKRFSRPVANYSLMLLSLVFSLALCEGGLRMFWNDPYLPRDDERNLLYRYDPILGWFPKENSNQLFVERRMISVAHNSKGFRDSDRKDTSKPRFVFLGDSFVWGYNVEAEERFTDKLQSRHPEITVYNFGVSGYGTDQEFLLLKKHLAEIKPSLVFLVFCSENDDEDNSWNLRYGTYYKPYFTMNGDSLRLNGVPVPPSERAFRSNHPLLCSLQVVRLVVRTYFAHTCPRPHENPNPTARLLIEMQKYLQTQNVTFAVGFTAAHPSLQAVLRAANIPQLDLSTTNRYEVTGHWTPEGHSLVCSRIENFLTSMPTIGRFLCDAKSTIGSSPFAGR